MDHIVVDSTPKGSAILAYGRARGPWLTGKLLAIIAGSFALIGGIAFIALNTRMTLLMPRDRLILVAFRPKTAASGLNTDLRQSLPVPWRAAVETRSRFAAILGVSLGPSDEPRAFALVPRTTIIASTDTLRVTDTGPYRLLTDGRTTEDFEVVPLQRVWSLTRRLRRHTASWSLNGLMMNRFAGGLTTSVEVTDSDELVGVWDGVRGTITTASTQDGSVSSIDASIFSLLGDDRDAASPAVEALTSQGIDLRGLSAAPIRLAVDTRGTGGLIIDWHENISSENLAVLHSTLDAQEHRDLLLPDQTSIRELTLGMATMTIPFTVSIRDGLSSTWEVWERGLRSPDWKPQIIQPSPTCYGEIRFFIQGQALRNLLAAWNVPDSWSKSIESFRIIETANGVFACMN